MITFDALTHRSQSAGRWKRSLHWQTALSPAPLHWVVMPLRIAVTVCDCADVIHAGGEPHRVTSIIELTEGQVPENLRRYFRDVATAKEHKEKYGSSGYVYQSVTLSLVE